MGWWGGGVEGEKSTDIRRAVIARDRGGAVDKRSVGRSVGVRRRRGDVRGHRWTGGSVGGRVSGERWAGRLPLSKSRATRTATVRLEMSRPSGTPVTFRWTKLHFTIYDFRVPADRPRSFSPSFSVQLFLEIFIVFCSFSLPFYYIFLNVPPECSAATRRW